MVGVVAKHHEGKLDTLIDIGTADGLMLDMLRPRLPADITMVGLDLSLELLRSYDGDQAHLMQADAGKLPIGNQAADLVISTAVIEHVPEPDSVITEFARIARPGALLVLTTPDPMIEEIATTLRMLKEDDHQETFRLKQLVALVERGGFDVVEARKFMFSPIGFPAEISIERMLHKMKLEFLMANQLVVGRRKSP